MVSASLRTDAGLAPGIHTHRGKRHRRLHNCIAVVGHPCAPGRALQRPSHPQSDAPILQPNCNCSHALAPHRRGAGVGRRPHQGQGASAPFVPLARRLSVGRARAGWTRIGRARLVNGHTGVGRAPTSRVQRSTCPLASHASCPAPHACFTHCLQLRLDFATKSQLFSCPFL